MTLTRTMDATFLNSVANHEEIRPWLGGSGVLDLGRIIENPENIGLQNEHGGFVVVKLDSGLYEAHSMFLPGSPSALPAMQECLRYLFVETEGVEVVTKVPEGNKAALGAARALGFSLAFRLDKGWPLADGKMGPVDCYSLTLAKWASKNPEAKQRGEWFHERLEQITEAAGKKIPVHYDEPAHNSAAGAAAMMYLAGNPVKATGIYNRWAAFAGFPPVRIISVTPLILDMQQAVILVRNSDMELLKCRLG